MTTKNGALEGCVAIVTGASRGAGRGIAIELGAAGATVIVTGRTTRASAPDTYRKFMGFAELEAMPGTIDDTAEAVTRAGGRGIPVRCDHGDDDDVRALFERVVRDHGRLDLLVNNAWGGHETFTPDEMSRPFWEHPIAHWESHVDRGARYHLIAARHAAPVFVRQKRGLVIATTFWDRDRYLRGHLYYDLAKTAINRLALALAEELRPHGVTSVALTPGFMRTELVLASMRTDEDHYRERPPLAKSETPHYLGRAVVALARDPEVASKSGKVLRVADLAREHGFTDLDGTQPEAFEIPDA